MSGRTAEFIRYLSLADESFPESWCAGSIEDIESETVRLLQLKSEEVSGQFKRSKPMHFSVGDYCYELSLVESGIELLLIEGLVLADLHDLREADLQHPNSSIVRIEGRGEPVTMNLSDFLEEGQDGAIDVNEQPAKLAAKTSQKKHTTGSNKPQGLRKVLRAQSGGLTVEVLADGASGSVFLHLIDRG